MFPLFSLNCQATATWRLSVAKFRRLSGDVIVPSSSSSKFKIASQTKAPTCVISSHLKAALDTQNVDIRDYAYPVSLCTVQLNSHFLECYELCKCSCYKGIRSELQAGGFRRVKSARTSPMVSSISSDLEHLHLRMLQFKNSHGINHPRYTLAMLPLKVVPISAMMAC